MVNVPRKVGKKLNTQLKVKAPLAPAEKRSPKKILVTVFTTLFLLTAAFIGITLFLLHYFPR